MSKKPFVNASNGSVQEAIVAVMASVSGVSRDGKVNAGKYSYKYTSAEAMIEAVRPAMIEEGLSLVPERMSFERIEYKASSGATFFMFYGPVVYRLYHAPSDTSVPVAVYGCGSDSGDKAANGAMTVAYKYAIRQAFGLPQNDDDPDTQQSPKTATRVQSKMARPPLVWHQVSAQAPIGMSEDEKTAWMTKVNSSWADEESYSESVTIANRAYQEYKDAQ